MLIQNNIDELQGKHVALIVGNASRGYFTGGAEFGWSLNLFMQVTWF